MDERLLKVGKFYIDTNNNIIEILEKNYDYSFGKYGYSYKYKILKEGNKKLIATNLGFEPNSLFAHQLKEITEAEEAIYG